MGTGTPLARCSLVDIRKRILGDCAPRCVSMRKSKRPAIAASVVSVRLVFHLCVVDTPFQSARVTLVVEARNARSIIQLYIYYYLCII